jgi:arylsulfatase A-like enzyme
VNSNKQDNIIPGWHLRLMMVIGLSSCLLGLSVSFALTSNTPAGPARAGAATSNAFPNIFLVVVDALRADHVSSYGYERATTPNLDSLVADRGVLFQNATAPSAWTFPSNAALLTGRSPFKIGVSWSDPQSVVPDQEMMLAEYLHDAGYYAAGFVSAHYVRNSLGFGQGFDIYDEQIGDTENSTRADRVNAMAMNWLGNSWAPISGTKPLFLFLYYFDPHTWYNPPPPYDTLYDPTYTGTLTASVYQDGESVVSGAIAPTERDVQHLKGLYDGEVTYWDADLGEMLTYLETLHLLDNSIVIVTSDHGEMFGEHGKWTHRNSLYEQVLRVPLTIRATGIVSAGLVVSSPVQTTDIVPTVLDWLGRPIPPDLQGMSLKLLTQGQPATGARDIMCEMDAITDPDVPGYWLAPRHELRSIRRGDWKYIHHMGQGGADELYRLQYPAYYEADNLLSAEPQIADGLFQALVDWFHIPSRLVYLPAVMR